MFEISQLKEKKLPELQEIAKELKVPKFKSLKKIDLVYQILDLQATNPTIVTPAASDVKTPRPRRERISKPEARPAVNAAQKKETPTENKSIKATAETKPTEKSETKPETKVESNGAPKINPRPQKQKNPNQKHGNNGNKDTRNRYKEPDFEFDAIIESEGVLDVMQDGYGFLRSSDYNYLA